MRVRSATTLYWTCEVRACDPKNGRNSHLAKWSKQYLFSFILTILFNASRLFTFLKSADCLHFQSQLIILGFFLELFGNYLGIIWELFGNSLEHVGLSVLLHAWNYCLNIVNDK